MSITVKVHLENEMLALVPTLRALSDVAIKVVTQGTTAPGTTAFPFYIDYESREELERALDADATVASYDPVDWHDGAGIYYIEHTPETKLISSVVTEVNGYLIHTETKGEGWLVRLLLPDRQALNTIWEHATDQDITFEIIEIYGNQAGGSPTYGLTDEQRAALMAAYERGYFEEPRSVSLSEVADELGLSSTATSGRLRRGMRNLIAATIGDRRDVDGETDRDGGA